MSNGVFIKTFGCQMNHYDSSKVLSMLESDGFKVVTDVSDADCEVVIFNTCHIREKANDKLFSEIGRLKKIKKQRREEGKNFIVVVMGCVAQVLGLDIVHRSGGCVDVVVGVQSIHKLPEIIKSFKVRQECCVETKPIVAVGMHQEEKFSCYDNINTAVEVPSAFITVQEGCENFCTYCVVPFTRGREQSRSMLGIKQEVDKLTERGVKEFILGGQNVNAYNGLDENGDKLDLVDLIEKISENPKVERIRFISSHPRNMSKRLIDAFGRIPVLMPFLHLPVQSGSDRILRMMNRHHDRQYYLHIIDQLKASCPKIAFSSDFIVGFPGENDSDFEMTMDLIKTVGYAQGYSFKFSARPDTPAENMPNQVPDAIKEERLIKIQELIAQKQQEFNDASVGSVQPVLFDRVGRHEGQVNGKTVFNQSVYVECDPSVIGHTKQVHIKMADKHSLSGVII